MKLGNLVHRTLEEIGRKQGHHINVHCEEVKDVMI